jgi:hypothetical protein
VEAAGMLLRLFVEPAVAMVVPVVAEVPRRASETTQLIRILKEETEASALGAQEHALLVVLILLMHMNFREIDQVMAVMAAGVERIVLLTVKLLEVKAVTAWQ